MPVCMHDESMGAVMTPTRSCGRVAALGLSHDSISTPLAPLGRSTQPKLEAGLTCHRRSDAVTSMWCVPIRPSRLPSDGPKLARPRTPGPPVIVFHVTSDAHATAISCSVPGSPASTTVYASLADAMTSAGPMRIVLAVTPLLGVKSDVYWRRARFELP